MQFIAECGIEYSCQFVTQIFFQSPRLSLYKEKLRNLTKLRKNSETTLSSARKIQNEGGLKKEINIPEQAVRALGSGLHLEKSASSQSYYRDYYEGSQASCWRMPSSRRPSFTPLTPPSQRKMMVRKLLREVKAKRYFCFSCWEGRLSGDSCPFSLLCDYFPKLGCAYIIIYYQLSFFASCCSMMLTLSSRIL